MLLDNFYHITRQELSGNNSWVVGCKLNPGHPIYQGHFPGQPVLPGVCTLQLIKECTVTLLQQPLRYARISSCKFLSAIDPEKNSELELEITTKEGEDGVILLQVSGRTPDQDNFIKLKAQLTKQGG